MGGEACNVAMGRVRLPPNRRGSREQRIVKRNLISKGNQIRTFDNEIYYTACFVLVILKNSCCKLYYRNIRIQFPLHTKSGCTEPEGNAFLDLPGAAVLDHDVPKLERLLAVLERVNHVLLRTLVVHAASFKRGQFI